MFAILQPPRQAAQPAVGALQRKVIPTAAGAGVKRLLVAAARRQRDRPRPLLRVGAAFEGDRYRFGARIVQLQQQAAARRAQTHLRLWPAQGAAQLAMKAVGAEQPQMVLILRQPVVADRLTRLDGKTARDLRQIPPIVDVKHRSLLAGIEQVQRHAALLGRDGGFNVQLVGQRAGRACQAALVGQTLVGGDGSGTCGSCSWRRRRPSAAWRLVAGRLGSASPLGSTKLNAEVRSPHTARRQALMLGSCT